jgi:hypothetical protein
MASRIHGENIQPSPITTYSKRLSYRGPTFAYHRQIEVAVLQSTRCVNFTSYTLAPCFVVLDIRPLARIDIMLGRPLPNIGFGPILK